MVNLNLTSIATEILPGLQALKEDLSLEFSVSGMPVSVEKGNGLTVELENGHGRICYSTKVEFFRGLSLLVQNIDQKSWRISQTSCFDKNGVMFDCSRNAVLTIDTLKLFLRKMSLMGLNLGMMYTEDTYEIKKRPYFGYLRGRYSFEELKELDDYADMLGIELIPCIQTLAHLERTLHWPCAENLKDTESVLLIGQDETYEFIEDMIVAASAPYRSNRIHIGMDEAWNLGRGAYLNKFGYRPIGELMADHLSRVNAIIEKHGLHAMMWSDMHFCAVSKTNSVYDPDCEFTPQSLAVAPADIDLVYWDYYHEHDEKYSTMLKKHGEFSAKTIFAGGIWTWTGPATDYRKTLAAALPALSQCKKLGIKEVFATAWGDDGAEANALTILYGLQVFAEFGYTGTYDETAVKERFRICAGADGQAFLDLSLFNELPGMKLMDQGTINPSKIILFEDPLIPLFEEDMKDLPCSAHYKEVAQRFTEYRTDNTLFSGLFDFYIKLANVLYLKSVWHENASACVRAKNMEQVKKMLELIDSIIISIKELKECWYHLWFSTNKPFGFEVIDIRLGGVISRFETARIRLEELLSGKSTDIPELSSPKLPYLRNENGEYSCLNAWSATASASRFVG